jgi:hypothetical protein
MEVSSNIYAAKIKIILYLPYFILNSWWVSRWLIGLDIETLD